MKTARASVFGERPVPVAGSGVSGERFRPEEHCWERAVDGDLSAEVLQHLAKKLGSAVDVTESSFTPRVSSGDPLADAKGGPDWGAAPPPRQADLGAGEAVLSTWRQLVDDAAGLAEEPHLAASAPAPRARLSAQTARQVGVAQGGLLTVSTDRGRITLPVVVDSEMVDGVVHLPSKSPGSWVLHTLGATNGDLVKLTPADARAGDEEAGK
jgi:NADH-quinone oxidoreductase subunit G